MNLLKGLSNKDIKGLFFDLDGTLVYSHRAQSLATQKALLDIGIKDYKLEYWKTNKGRSMQAFLHDLYPKLSNEDIELVYQQKSLYFPQFIETTILNKELLKIINDNKQKRQIWIITGARKVTAYPLIKIHNLENRITGVVYGDECKNRKPFPDLYLTALKRSNLNSNEVLVYEDTNTGIKSAINAGILKKNTILVNKCRDFIL